MRVVVGSGNPVKVEAVRRVFSEAFPGCEAVSADVLSGVSEQPMSEEETIKGARYRAKKALEGDSSALYGVGLEGGVYEQGTKLFECAWCVITNRDGEEGMGGGLRFELPPVVSEKIRAGGELGPVMNELLKREDVKKQEGAVGVFTKNGVTRTGAYQQLVHLALMKFVSPDWWE